MAASSHIQTLSGLDAWNEAATAPAVDTVFANGAAVLPGLSPTVGTAGANGVVGFTGTADAGSIVEIAKQMPGGQFELIAHATANAAGVFTFTFPESALGYGTVTLAARELNASWSAGAWSAGTNFSFTDPEAGLLHVGADLADNLKHDAATGADATADLQAVANEVASDGGVPAVLDIPAGTYNISSTILLYSGTFVDDPGVTLVAAPDWQRPVPNTTAGDLLSYTMVANFDYASATVQDSNIQIRNLAFDWNGFVNYGSTAVRFINAENVLVQNTSFDGNEDGTAFLHCDGAVVNDCTAVNTVNYAFDNWQGPTNTVIENSIAYVAWGSGISITGRGTASADNETADHDTVIGNTVYGNSGPGIGITSLSLGSAVNNVFVAGNLLVGPGTGIAVTGTGSSAVVADNTISGSLQQALQVSNINVTNVGTAGLQLQNVVVTGNTIGNAIVPAGNIAAVIVQAQGAGVFGNTVQYGSQRYDLWLAGDDETSSGNIWDDWQVGAVNTAWSANLTLLDAPGSSSSPGTGQAPYTLTNGTLTITGAGTLDLRGRSGISAVKATEGIGETIYLPDGGVHLTVTSTPGTGLPGTVGFGAPGFAGGLTIYGAAAADTIDLGAGDDMVVLGGTQETVRGGGGADTFYLTAATAGATIDGGSGASQVVVTGGGTVTLGAGISDIATVKIADATSRTTLSLNGLPGLTAYGDDRGDTLIAGGPNQTLEVGLGADTLWGEAGGDTVFAGRAAALEGDNIENFALGDAIDVTSVGTLNAGFSWQVNRVPGMTTVFVFNGSDGTGVNVAGTIDGTRFHLVPDGGLGVEVVYAPDIYTVFNTHLIADVLGRINMGGSDATTDTAFTMLFGGLLLPGGTVALTANMAPIDLPTGSSLTIDAGGDTLNAGAFAGLTVMAGDAVVRNLTMVGSNGAIALGAGAGALRLEAAGSFGGGVTLGGGKLVLGVSGAAGVGTIAFTAAATLEIAAGVSVANTIEAFGTDDAVMVDGVGNGVASYSSATHQLTITGTGDPEVLQLDAGVYYAKGFKTASEGSAGGTVVTYIACFAAGTRIATPAGEVAVDDLRIGDLVTTVSGVAKPVKWIGRRGYSAAEVATSPNLRPVVVCKGALGSGLPGRDLVVSPMHALLIDDVLVPAAALVNDGSILRREAVDAVEYFHVELHRHDVIFAEGAPAETFMDDNSRAMFENASEYYDLYGKAKSPRARCYPAISALM